MNASPNNTIPGNLIWKHIEDITPNKHDIPFGFRKLIMPHRFINIPDFNLESLLASDPDFKEYYDAGENRYSDDDVNPYDINHEIVVVNGELLDGYSRAATLLKNGIQTTNAYVNVPNNINEQLSKIKSLMGVINEVTTNGKTLINVDIQPEYLKGIHFNLYQWVDMINKHKGKVIFLYNGYDTMGLISEDEYKIWLYELGIKESIVYGSAILYDKGYCYFRSCIDANINDQAIVQLVKFMIENNINDSRYITPNFWKKFINKYKDDDYSTGELKDLLEMSDDCINIPNLMDFLRKYNNILICGGGQNECLKEVEIALMALDIPYTSLNEFIYEKNI
jgi:hypothetical protein